LIVQVHVYAETIYLKRAVKMKTSICPITAVFCIHYHNLATLFTSSSVADMYLAPTLLTSMKMCHGIIAACGKQCRWMDSYFTEVVNEQQWSKYVLGNNNCDLLRDNLALIPQNLIFC